MKWLIIILIMSNAYSSDYSLRARSLVNKCENNQVNFPKGENISFRLYKDGVEIYNLEINRISTKGEYNYLRYDKQNKEIVLKNKSGNIVNRLAKIDLNNTICEDNVASYKVLDLEGSGELTKESKCRKRLIYDWYDAYPIALPGLTMENSKVYEIDFRLNSLDGDDLEINIPFLARFNSDKKCDEADLEYSLKKKRKVTLKVKK